METTPPPSQSYSKGFSLSLSLSLSPTWIRINFRSENYRTTAVGRLTRISDPISSRRCIELHWFPLLNCYERKRNPKGGTHLGMVARWLWSLLPGQKKRAAISLIASTRFLLFPLKEFGWKNIRQKFEQLAVSWRQTTRIFLHHFTCLTFEWSHFDDRY